MDLLIIVAVSVLIGFVVWVLTTKVKMPPGWATAIQVIALVLLILWIVSVAHVHIPNVLR